MSKNQKLDRANIEDILVLSSMQDGMLFHYIDNPNSDQYFEQISLEISGNINEVILEKAWNYVAKNNEMLRTVYRWEKLDKPLQIVLKKYQIPVNKYDISREINKDTKLNDIRIEDRKNGIDLTNAPLRISLVKMDDNKYEMIISNHHIIYDGWSNGIILKELIDTYNRLCKGEEPIRVTKNKYKEFVKWCQNQKQQEIKEYWKETLGNFDTKTELPVDFKKQGENILIERFNYKIPNDIVNKIDDFTKEHKTTMATLLYTAWGILLQKYNNKDEVVFGTTVSGRTAKIRGINDIVGLFINTLPLKVSSSSNETIIELLNRTKESLKDREKYENTPLPVIKSCSGIDNNENLFDSIVVIENYPLDKQLNNSKNEINISNYTTFEMTNFDLSLAINTFEDIELNFLYNKEIFTEETIIRYSKHFERILENILERPNMGIKNILLLSKEEKQKIVVEYNDTKTSYPKDKTIHEIFEEQVEKNPNKVALEFEDKSITYGELNRKSNQIARYLRNKSVTSDTIVGMIFDRSLEMIVTIFGILKAGGAYLPIDPVNPKERIEYMLKDSGAKLLITDGLKINDLDYSGEVINIKEENIFEGDDTNLDKVNKSDNLVYVIYTSGSTGKPKGNLTMHYNVTRVVKDTNYIDITEKDNILQLSNYAFDGSTFDIYGALLNGSKLVLVDKDTLLEIDKLSRFIDERDITVFFVTTALFNTLVDINIDSLRKVRKILFGGERVSLQHAKKALEYLGKDRIIHVYGPTESTVYATYYHINEVNERLGTVPIGKPLANTQSYILDKNNNLCPTGIVGELCLGGDGLAKGYLNRLEKTNEVFVENPVVPEEKMYRTGDLAKWLPDGNIEFVGRIDHQVKIRGFRIELGEIENQLLKHKDIKEAKVIAKEDSNSRYLCGYIVGDRELNISDIKAHLLEELPKYMVPSYIIQLEKMPLNQNGKINTKALPDPSESLQTNEEYQAPRNDMEIELANMWQELLGIKKVGINDDFFELGGHSLKVTRLVAKIHKTFDVKLNLKQIFAEPTIKKIADNIHKAKEDNVESKYLTIEPSISKEYYPVSSAQKGMFIQEQFKNIGISYNMPIVLQIEGEIDKDKIGQAFEKLVKRHESLRTSFEIIDGEIVQKINNNVEFKVNYTKSNKNEVEKDIYNFIKPFDLNKAPLFRIKLIELNPNKYILIMDMHHIISDGVSVKLLIDDFAKLYKGEEIPDIKLHYKDYTVWHQDYINSEDMKRQGKYWLEQLSDDIPVLNLPTDFNRSDNRSFDGGVVKLNLPKEKVDKLKEFANKYKTTMNVMLFAIYNVLLNKYSRQDDIIVGSLVAGREHPELQNIVGMFNNFLPIRNHINTDKKFSQFIINVNEVMLNSYENQEYPFDKIVEQTNIKGDKSRNSLFDTMMIYHNQYDENIDVGIKELNFTRYEIEHNTAKLDLKLDIFKDKDELKCIFEYNTGLFKETTIERLGKHFVNIIDEVLEIPDKKLSEIEMISDKEKDKILIEFNNTNCDYPKDKTLHKLFEEQVEKTPNSIAAMYIDKELTFKELNEKANQLARKLREKGIKPNDIVGIMLQRSLEMTIGIMAIIKAGGAYLPIDPKYPKDRIEYMLNDSEAKVLLVKESNRCKTNSNNVKEIKQNIILEEINFNGVMINIEDEGLYQGETENLEYISNPQDLAYIIYTSGSTGKPKGVMIEHYSAINRIDWMQKKYTLNTEDTILQKTPYTFDVSVWELFWWSLTGSKVCFLKPEGEKNPEEIVEAIEKYKITTMHFVPSMLNIFLEYVEGHEVVNKLKSLKRVFASGEALSLQSVNKFNKLLNNTNGTKLTNLYGPTEATVDVSYFDCFGEDFDIIPIGKPINNIDLYIVNKENKLQPVGIPGELCISGDGVARGYLNRPELTKEKFVDNPFKPDEKMYKTGDLARWLADGNIEYLGRIDHQVKVRGFRIELGEIENKLLEHGDIKEAVVLARDDNKGIKYLCGYIVADREMKVKELRKHLEKELPEYMVPQYFVQLDCMPLTSNGKANRKALPEPDGSMDTGTEYVPPQNEIEEKLVEIWKEVLKVDIIGINDDFFEIGGNSLSAAGITTKIHKVFDINISLSEIFDKTTIKELAVGISKKDKNVYSSIEKSEEKDYYPLASAQKRLFILDRMESTTTYNLPEVMLVEGKLERSKLEEVFTKIIERHESLRTSFHLIEGEAVQKVHDTIDFSIQNIECEEYEVDEKINEFIRPFDLSQAPLLRVGLIKISEAKHILMFDMHHIISDGVSIIILVKEFMELYKERELPELKIQYKDYGQWQNKFLESEEIKTQEKYWLEKFRGDIPVLNLPTDYQRPSLKSYEGDKISFELEDGTVKGLNNLAKETGTTLYMVLMATYNVLMSKYTGQEDIVIGSPVVGRPHVDLENIIGMFVNTLAMRNFPTSNKTFNEFLIEVKENSLKAFENQDYQFELLVDKLDLDKDMSRNPLFDTMLVLQNMGVPETKLEEITFKPYKFKNNVSKFDITLEVMERQNNIIVNIEYSTKLFKKSTIERLGHHFKNIVNEVIEKPNKKLSEIHMIIQKEKEQIIVEFNDTKVSYPLDKTLHKMFEEQVELNPNNIAAIYDNDTLTYIELNEKSNQVARKLREKGVKPKDIVGIMLKRSLEMTIGIMAIIKAGGAYLPIDPKYPIDRIEYMLKDSRAKILLAKNDIEYNLKDNSGEQEQQSIDIQSINFDGEIINLEDKNLYQSNGDNLEYISSPNDLAYIIYTSGSTGKPKGVMIEHHSAINRIDWMQSRYNLDENDVILQKTPFTFDVSVWELFWWSMIGSKVCFLKPEGEKDPQEIINTIDKYKVTTMHFVPSMLNIFLEYIEGHEVTEQLKSLKRVFASGEALSLQSVNKFNKLLNSTNGTRLTNLYGPTEATVDVSYFDCFGEDFEIIPIGKPINNINLYIVNKDTKLQPIGVAGELCIAGVGVARGYLNRPELTAEKFVSNPFKPESKMYKTGDLVRWMPDGNIEYLGRIDHQVKIRGFRIELGEIENRLLDYEDIKEAVVLARDDNEGNKYLCGYIISDREMKVKELREHLLRELPEYMVPQYFVQLDTMPLTANGKVNRKALPKPDGNMDTGVEYLAPKNEIEEKLQNIWQEILGVDKIGTKHNFFDVGGTSLLLINMHSKLEIIFSCNIKVTDVFANPTIEKLAEFIQKQLSSNKNIEVKALEIAKHYFARGVSQNKTSTLKFQFKDTLYDKLKLIASKEKVELNDLLLGSFTHLLSQVAAQKEINIQRNITNNVIAEIEIDFNNMSDFSQLLKEIKESTDKLEETYSLDDISNIRFRKNQNTVIPLFYEKGSISKKIDILDYYDIALEVENNSNAVNFKWEYNTRLLDEKKIESLANNYIKLNRLIVKQYQI